MDRTQLLIGVAVALFSLGLVGVIVRRHVLVMLMCMELMLNGVNLSLVTFAQQTSTTVGAVLVFLHVSDRIDVDRRADAGDHERHHGTQPVEVEGDLEARVADLGPAVGGLDQRCPARGLEPEDRQHDESERGDRQTAADGGHEAVPERMLAEPRREGAVQQEAQQGQEDDRGQHDGTYPLRSL